MHVIDDGGRRFRISRAAFYALKYARGGGVAKMQAAFEVFAPHIPKRSREGVANNVHDAATFIPTPAEIEAAKIELRRIRESTSGLSGPLDSGPAAVRVPVRRRSFE